MAFADRVLAGQSSRWLALGIIPLASFAALYQLDAYDPLLQTSIGHIILVGGSSLLGAILS